MAIGGTLSETEILNLVYDKDNQLLKTTAGGGGGGGGTQYAEGATPATPTGNLGMWKDSGGVMRSTGSAYPVPMQTLDVAAATGSISAVDAASTTVTGAGGQNVVTGTPTASSFVMQAFSGNSSFSILITGTFVATLVFERSLDGGTTWGNIGAYAAGTNSSMQSTTQIGAFHGNASSCTNVRVRCTSFTSGSASIRILSGEGVGTVTIGSASRGVYVASPSAATDGASIAMRLDALANMMMNMQSKLDPVNDGITNYDYGHSVAVITTATTTTVKTGSGTIKSIRVVGGTLGNVTVYDNTAASGTVLVPTVTPTQGQILLDSAGFTAGCTIVTAAATLLVVTYR